MRPISTNMDWCCNDNRLVSMGTMPITNGVLSMTDTTETVPEPTTLLLAGAGILGCVRRSRWRPAAKPSEPMPVTDLVKNFAGRPQKFAGERTWQTHLVQIF